MYLLNKHIMRQSTWLYAKNPAGVVTGTRESKIKC